jgi:hypothetical protein
VPEFACDSSLTELESSNSVSRPVAGWRAMPRRPCLSLSGLGPRHRPCRRAWHDQDLHDSSSDPLAFMWDHACSPEALSILWRLGQCVPNIQLESKASRRIRQVLRFLGRSTRTDRHWCPVRTLQSLQIGLKTPDSLIVRLCCTGRTQGSSFIPFGQVLGKSQAIFGRKA